MGRKLLNIFAFLCTPPKVWPMNEEVTWKQQLEFLNAAGENIKQYNYFVKLAISLKVKLNTYPYEPAISFLGIYVKRNNVYVLTKTLTLIFMAALFITGHYQISINIWMDKQPLVHLLNGINKKELLIDMTWTISEALC